MEGVHTDMDCVIEGKACTKCLLVAKKQSNVVGQMMYRKKPTPRLD